MENQTVKIHLPIADLDVEVKSFMITKEYFELQKTDDVTKYALENFIVSIGEEKDKAKFYDLVMNLRLEDYLLIDKGMSKLLELLTSKKK